MTKQQLKTKIDNLLNQLQIQQATIHKLETDNQAMQRTLMNIYTQTRTTLGIEAAIQERENQRIKNEQNIKNQ